MTLDGGPEGEGGDVGLVNQVEDIGGNSSVDLVDDATVDLMPLSITLGEQRRRTDMVLKAEFAKNRVEAASPLAVIRDGVVEHD